MKRIYRSFQGRDVDMDQLLQKNETMPAVGNVRVNARGDELGPDGNIVRTREDVLSEYYDSNPNAVIDDEQALSKVKIQSRRQEVRPELKQENAAQAKPKAKEIK